MSHGNILKGVLALFNNIGDFIALAATVCWAIYVFAVKHKPKNLSFRSFVYSTFLIGTTLICPLYLFDIFYLKHSFEPTIVNMSVIFCLGFGVSIIGMMSLNISIVKIGPNISAILFYFAPIFTSIMAVTLLKEELQPFHIIGILSILLGVNFPLIAHFFAYKSKPYNSKEEKLQDND